MLKFDIILKKIMARICKRCNVEMNVKNLKTKRRGNQTTNMPEEHYCPKCDHSEYGHS